MNTRDSLPKTIRKIPTRHSWKSVISARLVTHFNIFFRWICKSKQGYGKNNFSNYQICHNKFFFLLENPTHWGLKTAANPIFVKPVLDIFAVCSLAPRMNLPHMQQSYFCTKNQNYLLKKVDLRFFLSCRLRITIKIAICRTFQAVIVKNCAKKYRPFQQKLFSKEKWNLLIWNKCY